MPALHIGLDGSGTPSLKITKDAVDDPRTTSDLLRRKFAYNSNDAAMAYIEAMRTDGLSYTAEPYSTYDNWRMYPQGSSPGNYLEARRISTGTYTSSTHVVARDSIPGLRYYCPLYSSRIKDPNSTLYIQFVGSARGQGSGYRQGGYVIFGGTNPWLYYSANFYETGQAGYMGRYCVPCTGLRFDHPFGSVPLGNVAIRYDTLMTFVSTNAPNQDNIIDDTGPQIQAAVFWNLPGENVPLNEAPPIAASPGLPAITISPSEFKVAKPGYNVDFADVSQLAFSASKRPAKIIGVGDVAIPSGGAHSHYCGVALDDTIAVEQAVYPDGAAIHFPAHPNVTAGWYCPYAVSGQYVHFYNSSGITLRVRYMIIAADDKTPTVGGANDVFRQFHDGTQDVIQIVRPGAQNPPNLADIVIDSRWPSIPILSEGYLDVLGAYNAGQMNRQIFDVNFSNPDNLWPFIKFACVCEAVRPGVSGWELHKYISRAPYIRRVNRDTGYDNQGGDSTYAFQIAANSFRFYAHRGRGIDYYKTSDDWGAPVVNDPDPHPIIGIRYYVFGLPV